MGQDKSQTTKNIKSDKDKTSLIDYLYIDDDRIDSYLSQIKNGTLRSVSKTTETSQGTSSNASAKVDLKFVEGKIGGNEDIVNNQSSTENYDPYHSKVTDFLELVQLDTLDLSENYISKLGVVLGTIIIRDLSLFSNVLPILLKHPKVFGPVDKQTKANLTAMQDLIKSAPTSIDLTIQTGFGVVTGTIDSSYLKTNISDILRKYGTELPGDWLIIGIFDTIPPKKEVNSDEDAQNATVEALVDIYTDATSQFYIQSEIKITPIIILRELNI